MAAPTRLVSEVTGGSKKTNRRINGILAATVKFKDGEKKLIVGPSV